MSETVMALLGGATGAALVVGLFDIIKWMLERRARKKDENNTKEDGVTCGVRMLLYDRIKHRSEEYISRGHIKTDELKDLLQYHECYHTDLGGNGFLDSVIEQVKGLQIKN